MSSTQEIIEITTVQNRDQEEQQNPKSPAPPPPPPPPPPQEEPNMNIYERSSLELSRLRDLAEKILTYALAIVNFHATVQVLTIGYFLSAPSVTCGKVNFAMVLGIFIAVPNIVFTVLMAMFYHDVMRRYDAVWTMFEEQQNRVMYHRPNEYVLITYGVSAMCAFAHKGGVRKACLALGVLCNIMFSLVTVFGPGYMKCH